MQVIYFLLINILILVELTVTLTRSEITSSFSIKAHHFMFICKVPNSHADNLFLHCETKQNIFTASICFRGCDYSCKSCPYSAHSNCTKTENAGFTQFSFSLSRFYPKFEGEWKCQSDAEFSSKITIKKDQILLPTTPPSTSSQSLHLLSTSTSIASKNLKTIIHANTKSTAVEKKDKDVYFPKSPYNFTRFTKSTNIVSSNLNEKTISSAPIKPQPWVLLLIALLAVSFLANIVFVIRYVFIRNYMNFKTNKNVNFRELACYEWCLCMHVASNFSCSSASHHDSRQVDAIDDDKSRMVVGRSAPPPLPPIPTHPHTPKSSTFTRRSSGGGNGRVIAQSIENCNVLGGNDNNNDNDNDGVDADASSITDRVGKTREGARGRIESTTEKRAAFDYSNSPWRSMRKRGRSAITMQSGTSKMEREMMGAELDGVRQSAVRKASAPDSKTTIGNAVPPLPRRPAGLALHKSAGAPLGQFMMHHPISGPGGATCVSYEFEDFATHQLANSKLRMSGDERQFHSATNMHRKAALLERAHGITSSNESHNTTIETSPLRQDGTSRPTIQRNLSSSVATLGRRQNTLKLLANSSYSAAPPLELSANYMTGDSVQCEALDQQYSAHAQHAHTPQYAPINNWRSRTVLVAPATPNEAAYRASQINLVSPHPHHPTAMYEKIPGMIGQPLPHSLMKAATATPSNFNTIALQQSLGVSGGNQEQYYMWMPASSQPGAPPIHYSQLQLVPQSAFCTPQAPPGSPAPPEHRKSTLSNQHLGGGGRIPAHGVTPADPRIGSSATTASHVEAAASSSNSSSHAAAPGKRHVASQQHAINTTTQSTNLSSPVDHDQSQRTISEDRTNSSCVLLPANTPGSSIAECADEHGMLEEFRGTPAGDKAALLGSHANKKYLQRNVTANDNIVISVDVPNDLQLQQQQQQQQHSGTNSTGWFDRHSCNTQQWTAELSLEPDEARGSSTGDEAAGEERQHSMMLPPEQFRTHEN